MLKRFRITAVLWVGASLGIVQPASAACDDDYASNRCWDGTIWNNTQAPPEGGRNGPGANPPVTYGTLTHHSFHSNTLGSDVGYNIYLPPQYVTQPSATFPVIYFFHGAGGDENSHVNCLNANAECDQNPYLDNAIHAGSIMPMIVVYVNEGRNSKHMDAIPGSPQYSTPYFEKSYFKNDLVPYIENTYRITPGQRAIQGFSMGGMGCMKMWAEYPGFWKSAYCEAPAIDDTGTPPPGSAGDSWPCNDTSDPSHGCTQSNINNNEGDAAGGLFGPMFNHDASAWYTWSVWGRVDANHAALAAAAVPLHVTIDNYDGLYTDGYQTRMFQILDGYGIPHDPLQVTQQDFGHDWEIPMLYGMSPPWQNWTFAANHFTATGNMMLGPVLEGGEAGNWPNDNWGQIVIGTLNPPETQSVYATHLNGDYGYPFNAEIDYYVSKGMKIANVLFNIERVQTGLNGTLREPDIGILDDLVNYAATKGMTLILTLHNYGYIFGQEVKTPSTDAAFAQFWGLMAAHYRDAPNVWFHLMEEPHTLTAEEWRTAANAAIAAIRAAGANQKVLISGVDDWDFVDSWTVSSAGAFTYTGPGTGVIDPQNNFMFYVISFPDEPYSSATVGAGAMVAATNWARTNHFKMFLGSMGVNHFDPLGLTVLNNTLAYMQQNSDVWAGVTEWMAGPRMPDGTASFDNTEDDAYQFEPDRSTTPWTDSPQMGVTLPYVAPADTTSTTPPARRH